MRTPTILHGPGATRRVALLQLGSALWGALGATSARADAPEVSIELARAEFAAGRVTLIDIREPDEHATGVVEGAKLLPMRQLAGRIGEVPNDPKQPVLLICASQNRSSATTRALRERGYLNVRYVQGGMREWARRGWPLVKPGG